MSCIPCQQTLRGGFRTEAERRSFGMRIGEILGLKWSDIDFEHQTIYVNRTLVYAKCDDKADPQYGKWRFDFHDPKTEKGRRKIPMTLKAYQILKKQRFWKSGIESRGRRAPEGCQRIRREAPVEVPEGVKVV